MELFVKFALQIDSARSNKKEFIMNRKNCRSAERKINYGIIQTSMENYDFTNFAGDYGVNDGMFHIRQRCIIIAEPDNNRFNGNRTS